MAKAAPNPLVMKDMSFPTKPITASIKTRHISRMAKNGTTLMTNSLAFMKVTNISDIARASTKLKMKASKILAFKRIAKTTTKVMRKVRKGTAA